MGSVLLRDTADVQRLRDEDGRTIFTFPVVLGGVMIGHYERAGEIKIGDTARN